MRTRRIAGAAISCMVFFGSLMSGQAVASDSEPPERYGCKAKWQKKTECSLTYAGGSIYVGATATGPSNGHFREGGATVTLEAPGTAGTPRVLLTCTTVSGGCGAASSSPFLSVSPGTPLKCIVRGELGRGKFACITHKF